MANYQLDILATKPDWFSLPRHLPGRLNAEDFIYLHYDTAFKPEEYRIVISTLDATEKYRTIAVPARQVELPHVQLPWNGEIGVIPINDTSLPSFVSKLNRGSTYIIPNVSASGRYQMEMHGMDRPSGL
jgi:hypothetical protein